jgi:hypothetical protein
VREALPGLGAPPPGAVVDRSVRAALDTPRWWVLALAVGPALALLFDGSGRGFAAVTLALGIIIARRRACTGAGSARRPSSSSSRARCSTPRL